MYSDRRDQSELPHRPEEVDTSRALRGYRAIQFVLGLLAALAVIRLLAQNF